MEFLDGSHHHKYKLDTVQFIVLNYHQLAEFYNLIQTETPVLSKSLPLKLEDIL